MKNFILIIFSSLILVSCFSLSSSNLEKFSSEEAINKKAHSNKGIILVLGAGGSKGLSHLGVLEELEAADIKISMIIGTSAGSIVGSLYSAKPNIRWLKNIMLKKSRSDFLSFNIFNSRFGLSRGDNLKYFLNNNLSTKHFEKLQIPFLAIATDLATGYRVELGQGDIVPAVLASSAYPIAFQPVQIGKRQLVDGGVVSPIATDVARRYSSGHPIVAVDISGKLPKSMPTNMFGVAKRCIEIMYKNHGCSKAAKADVLIKPSLKSIGVFDDGHNNELYLAGKVAARSKIKDIKKLLISNSF